MDTIPPSPRHDAADDVDRLFARLDRVEAPVDLTSRVLASTVAGDAARQLGGAARQLGGAARPRTVAWPWLAAAFGALAALTMAGYLLGVQLAASDGLDLLEGVASDLSLLASEPGDILLALAEAMPFGLVALAAASVAVLVCAAGHLASRSAVVDPRAS